MISRKLVVFLTSLVIYSGVHTVAADPVTSVQQPNIQVRPLSQALVNPLPARQLTSSDSAKIVGDQLRDAYRAAVAAKQGVAAGSSTGRLLASGSSIAPEGPWGSKTQNASEAPVYKAQPTVQKISATGGDLDIRLRNNGTLLWVGISKGSVRNSLSAIGKNLPPENIARDFLNRNQPLLGIENPSKEFELDSVHVDSRGTQHLRFQQVYGGVPVWGRQLLAQVTNRGHLTSLVGSYSQTPRKLVLNPTVDASAALRNAKQIYDPRGIGEGNSLGLVIVTDETPLPKLAWQSEIIVSDTEKWLVLVDAHTGRVIDAISQIYSENILGQGIDLFGQSQDLNVWQEGGVHYLVDTSRPMFDPTSVPLDLNNSRGVIYIFDLANQEEGATGVFSLTGPTGPWLADGVSAAVNLAATYNYFRSRHGRESLDGQGGNIYALVRWGVGIFNATFDASTQVMRFGDAEPFAGALDVVAHELTHGVISTSANLVYQDQSGALNEAFADIFGEMVEARQNGRPDWLLGSRLSSPIRNMADPGSLISGLGRPYPSKFSEFEVTALDYGGVHINSSIINHAYYQLAEGLPDAIGIPDAANIFYRALTTKLTPLSDFFDARFALILSAEELFGVGSTQALSTAAALDAVEIFDAPSNPLPTPTPEVVGPDSTLFTYWDPNAAAYFLGRLETDIDPPQGSQLSVGPIFGARASVDGAGEIAIFVNDQNDACFIATSGGVQESCAGLTGQIASVAMAADGETFGLVLLDSQGNPTNRITIIDFATNSEIEYVLEAPVFDGVSSIQVVQADAMDFTNDSRFLVYDAFNIADFGDNVLGLWSLYAIDLLSGTTFPLIAPTPDFNTAYPSVAQTSDGHMTFDAFDLINNENIVATADVYSGQTVGLVISGQNYSIPSYTGDDGAVVFSSEDVNVPTGGNLWQIPLADDRITPVGGPTLWLQDSIAGSIYRRGSFEGASRVDLNVEFQDLQPVVGHQVLYRVRLTNNGPNAANVIRMVITLPEGVTVDQVDGAFQCTGTAAGQQAQCDIPGPLRTPDLDGTVTVQIVVNAPNVDPFTTSVTAFAEETDTNSVDNTAFLDVPASMLNYSPELDQAISDQVTQEGRSFSLDVSANFSDRDQDALTFSATGLPASLTIGADSGQILGTLTSADVQSTSYAITVTAADPFGGEVQGGFNLTVNAAPPPPPPPSGGGGGGGSTGLLMLMLLSSVWALRRRDRVFN